MAARASEKILSGPILRLQPDRRLVTLASEGSEAAIEEIVRRYRPALVRYARSIVGADRAEDVVQDSLAKAVPAIGAGVEELHLRRWLYTIVRNTGLNALRDAGPTHQQLDENHDGVEQPPQALERSEQVRSLVRELKGLPDAQRQALVKREMEGLGHDEIGADLGVSTGAARQLIFRARDALRAGLGSLVPMPLLRYLVEGGGDGGAVAATAATGGGAVGVKVAVAIIATGAVVGGGLAVRHGEQRQDRGSAPPPLSREATLPIVPPGGAVGGIGAALQAAGEHPGRGAGGSRGDGGGHGGGDRHGEPEGRGDGSSESSGQGSEDLSGSSAPERYESSGSGDVSSGSGEGGGSHHGGGGEGGGSGHGSVSEGGDVHSGSASQPVEAIESDSNSGSDGGGSSSGSSADSSGSSGSGSGSSGGDRGGEETTLELSRDSGGGDGL